jgi:hypothetical protein
MTKDKKVDRKRSFNLAILKNKLIGEARASF